MSLTLAEALGHVDLESGHTYRETVNGRIVEVRVFEDAPTPELAEQVMLLPWFDFPFTAVGTVRAQPGVLPLPDPPVIPSEDEYSE